MFAGRARSSTAQRFSARLLSRPLPCLDEYFRLLMIFCLLSGSLGFGNPADRRFPMTQTITPLRQRMLDDMKLRNMALSTRKIYVASVAGFSAYHGRSPDELTLEDVRDYQMGWTTLGIEMPHSGSQPSEGAVRDGDWHDRSRYRKGCVPGPR